MADYLNRYKPVVDKDLDEMEDILGRITNLTTGATEKVTYMKDSATQHQKSGGGDWLFCILGYLTVLNQGALILEQS